MLCHQITHAYLREDEIMVLHLVYVIRIIMWLRKDFVVRYVYLQSTSLLRQACQIVKKILFYSFSLFQSATMQNPVWNLLFMGWMVLPLRTLTGPLNVPVKLAIKRIQSPWPNNALNGSLSIWLSEKVLKTWQTDPYDWSTLC